MAELSLVLPVPEPFLEALAVRVAELVEAKLPGAQQRWFRIDEAADY